MLIRVPGGTSLPGCPTTVTLISINQSSWWNFFTWMPHNSNSTSLRRVLVLAMIALCTNQVPSICFDQLDNVSNFHPIYETILNIYFMAVIVAVQREQPPVPGKTPEYLPQRAPRQGCLRGKPVRRPRCRPRW